MATQINNYDPNTGRKLNPGETVINKQTGQKVTQGTVYAAPAVAPAKTMGSMLPATPTSYSTPTAKTASVPNPNQSQIDSITSKLSELKSQLGVAQASGYTGANANKEIKYDSSGKIVKASDVYSDYSSYDKAQNQYTSGLDKINADLESAKSQQKTEYSKLATYQTDLYNKTYASLGLDSKKSKIAEMDSAITAKTAERDKTVTDANGKPIAQWLITGDLKQSYDKYNNEITQLTNERNAAATEYNTNLDELDKQVEAGMTDAKTSAAYWDSQVANLTNQATNYQSQLMSILKGESEAAAASAKTNVNKTDTIEANGRQYLVTYDSDGKIISKTDLGAAKTTSPSTKTESVPSSFKEYQLAQDNPGYASYLKNQNDYTPTQQRSRDKEVQLLQNDINLYKGEWAKTGDKGAGTREDLIANSLKDYPNLTADEIKKMVYQDVSDSWLSTNQKKGNPVLNGLGSLWNNITGKK